MPVAQHLRSLLCAVAAALPLAGTASPATDPLPCVGQTTGLGTGELTCAVDTASGAQVRCFEAVFSGVHDDSQAAVSASVDGAPLACDAGSKDRLDGDADGDRLHCRLLIPAAPAQRTVLLRLRWHHAEPARFTFVPDQP